MLIFITLTFSHGCQVLLSHRSTRDLSAFNKIATQIPPPVVFSKNKVITNLNPKQTGTKFYRHQLQTFSDIKALLFATGYQFDYDFFSKQLNFSYSNQKFRNLYQHILPTEHLNNLAIIGIPSIVIPFPLFDTQVRFVIGCWFTENGKQYLSKQKETWLENEILKRKKYPEHYFHRMHDGMQWEYLKDLEKSTFPKVPDLVKNNRKVSKTLYEHAWKVRFENPLDYKLEQLSIG